MYGSIIYIIEVHVSVIAVYYGGLCIPVFQDIDTSQSFLTFLLCCLGYFYDIVIGVCACSVVPLYSGHPWSVLMKGAVSFWGGILYTLNVFVREMSFQQYPSFKDYYFFLCFVPHPCMSCIIDFVPLQ